MFCSFSHQQKFLQFAVGDYNFQFVTLPFYLSMAPLEFTKVLVQILWLLRTQGVPILRYLDDLLLREKSSYHPEHKVSLTHCSGQGDFSIQGSVLRWEIRNSLRSLSYLSIPLCMRVGEDGHLVHCGFFCSVQFQTFAAGYPDGMKWGDEGALQCPYIPALCGLWTGGCLPKGWRPGNHFSPFLGRGWWLMPA